MSPYVVFDCPCKGVIKVHRGTKPGTILHDCDHFQVMHTGPDPETNLQTAVALAKEERARKNAEEIQGRASALRTGTTTR